MGERMSLTSPAFTEGADIPRRHTCEGEDVSPPLVWTGVPGGARSLVVTADDPDAPGGVFVHWLAWGIAPGARALRGDTGRTATSSGSTPSTPTSRSREAPAPAT